MGCFTKEQSASYDYTGMVSRELSRCLGLGHGASMHKEWHALATEIARMEASELPMIGWRSVRGRVSATHYQDTDGYTYCGIKIPEDARIVAGGPLCQHGHRRRAQVRGVRRYLETLPQRK